MRTVVGNPGAHADEVYIGMNWSASVLPPWLDFSSYTVPLAGDKGINYTGLRYADGQGGIPEEAGSKR
jgi:hypothetical protein